MSLLGVLDALLVEVHGFLQEPALLAVCRVAQRRAALKAHLDWVLHEHRLWRRSLVMAMERALCHLAPGPGGRMPISAQLELRRALFGPQEVPFPGEHASEDEMIAYVLSRGEPVYQ